MVKGKGAEAWNAWSGVHFQCITCAALLSKHFLCQGLVLWIKWHSLVCVRWCHRRTLVCVWWCHWRTLVCVRWCATDAHWSVWDGAADAHWSVWDGARCTLVCVRWCHWRTLVCVRWCATDAHWSVSATLLSGIVHWCRLLRVSVTLCQMWSLAADWSMLVWRGSDMVHCKFVNWLPSRGMSDDVNTVVYQTWPWRKEVYHLDLWAYASACRVPRVGEGGPGFILAPAIPVRRTLIYGNRPLGTLTAQAALIIIVWKCTFSSRRLGAWNLGLWMLHILVCACCTCAFYH